MTRAAWSVAWAYAGESGVVDGASVNWSESVSLARVVGNWRTANIEITIPLDVMAAASRGFHPRTGTAALAFGDRPVLSGSWRDVAFEPLPNGSPRLSFVLTVSDTEDRGAFPALSKSRPDRDPNEVLGWSDLRVATPRERVRLGFPPYTRSALDVEVYTQDPILRKDKWPNIAEPAEGAGWPYPFGSPGRGGDVPAVPAYTVVDSPGDATQRRILIAGTAIRASTVTVWGPSTSGGSDLTSDSGIDVHHDADEDGYTYAYVIAGDLTNVNGNPQNTFYWSSPDATTTPGGAGDLLLAIFGASTLPYDAAEFARLLPVLNGYQLDGYVDAVTSPIDLITGQILPLLPIAIVPGPNGFRPVLLPFHGDRSARGLPLVDDVGVTIDGPVRYLDPAGTETIALRYGFRADRLRSTRRVRESSRTGLLSRFAPSGLTDLEARFLWDDATAGRVASDLAVSGSWAPRVVTLTVTQDERYGPGGTEDLEPGRRVLLTSSRLGLSGAAAVVGEREYDAARTLVRVWLLDDPVVPR